MHTAVEFEKSEDGSLILAYRPRDDDEWVQNRFKRNEDLVIKGTFRLAESDLLPPREAKDDAGWRADEPLRFRIGSLQDGYYMLDDRVLEVGVPVLLHQDSEITWKWFTAERRVSVFSQIAELRPRRIVVGGPATDAIPEAAFLGLIRRFPSGHELHRYSLARVAAVVREYTDTAVDAERLYQNYLGRRVASPADNLLDTFREAEVQKFELLYERLTRMLQSEESYAESRWQSEILQIIRLLNPRYIQAFEGVSIRDLDARKNREIDILLIDASGNVDVVEIKKPFDKSVVSEGTYRDNHIPLRELSGAVMQIEKYIYYLNRWGTDGERVLSERFAAELPTDFKISITNPTGIVIIGRDRNLTPAQRRDFEVVKRKYKNIVDIVTYDDLLRRLQFVLQQLSKDA
ncbi:MAG: DUF4263 domain-containing protein [Burkholderiales bacterium]|nr:DUF4263 domain-containing protein [Burkholderiales bacterium]